MSVFATKEPNNQTNKHANRQTDKQAYRQTNKHTNINKSILDTSTLPIIQSGSHWLELKRTHFCLLMLLFWPSPLPPSPLSLSQLYPHAVNNAIICELKLCGQADRRRNKISEQSHSRLITRGNNQHKCRHRGHIQLSYRLLGIDLS